MDGPPLSHTGPLPTILGLSNMQAKLQIHLTGSAGVQLQDQLARVTTFTDRPGPRYAGPAHAGKTLNAYHSICRGTITRPAGPGHHFPVLSRSALSRAGPCRQNSKYTSQDLQGDPGNDITFHRRQVQHSKATFVYKPLDYHTCMQLINCK